MDDLTAAIRAALADPEHEDWCHERTSPGCCEHGCDCFLGPRTNALRAVLDMCDRTFWIMNAYDVRRVIAEQLGVSVGGGDDASH